MPAPSTGSPFTQDELEGRFRAIVETALDGIITIDSRGVMDTVNPAACKLFGYAAAEILGRNVSFLMPSPHSERHDAYINRYLGTGEKRIIGIGREVPGLRKDGSTFPFWLSVSEFRLGDRIIFTGLVHDISELKVSQEEVESLNEQLERQNAALEKKVDERTEQLADLLNQMLAANKNLQSEISERLAVEAELQLKQEELIRALSREKELHELKSRFVSIASHEFRTPLSTVLSSAALVRKYAELGNLERQGFHLDKIKAAVNHLTGILNDFLSLSKIDEGKLDVQPETFDFQAFLDENTEEMSALLKPGQNLLLQRHSTEPLEVFLDKRLLKNIFLNLVSNAIKYSEKDVTLSTRLDNGRLTLAVEDRGIGIPKADQVNLFERFFRAGNAGNIPGTGLGLSIVKRYVDMMGGEISYDSREERGTVFTVSFPLKPES